MPSTFGVTLIGAGGIGAITALTLAKMGVQHLEIYDDDVVGEENLATQWHKVGDLGHQKAAALCSTLLEYSDDVQPSGYAERVDASFVLRSNLVISAVDSVTARQEIWRALRNEQSRWEFYLDMRMAAQEFQHFLIPESDPRAVTAYDQQLMSLAESDIEEVACTEKATIFCALAAAAHAGTVVADILTGRAAPHRLIHYIRPEVIYRLPI